MAVARERNSSVSVATCFIYNTLGVVLARNNAVALLARYRDTRVGAGELLLGAGVPELRAGVTRSGTTTMIVVR